jgi:hypothetical protein
VAVGETMTLSVIVVRAKVSLVMSVAHLVSWSTSRSRLSVVSGSGKPWAVSTGATSPAGPEHEYGDAGGVVQRTVPEVQRDDRSDECSTPAPSSARNGPASVSSIIGSSIWALGFVDLGAGLFGRRV